MRKWLEKITAEQSSKLISNQAITPSCGLRCQRLDVSDLFMPDPFELIVSYSDDHTPMQCGGLVSLGYAQRSSVVEGDPKGSEGLAPDVLPELLFSHHADDSSCMPEESK